jgi:hypothetical protein
MTDFTPPDMPDRHHMANVQRHGGAVSAEVEAQQLLSNAAAIIARSLSDSIASLSYPVGMGLAPHPDACRAAADKITEKFAGAVLAAIEGERVIAEAVKLDGDWRAAVTALLAEPSSAAAVQRGYALLAATPIGVPTD